jgi:hypothetical protein
MEGGADLRFHSDWISGMPIEASFRESIENRSY